MKIQNAEMRAQIDNLVQVVNNMNNLKVIKPQAQIVTNKIIENKSIHDKVLSTDANPVNKPRRDRTPLPINSTKYT